MMFRQIRVWAIVHSVIMIALTASAVSAQKRTVEGRVTYVAEQSYYTDIGKDKGAVRGDTLYSNDPRRPLLIIQSISRKSSYCIPVNKSIKINVGQPVVAEVVVREAPASGVSTKDTTRNILSDPVALWSGVIVRADSSAVRGSANVQQRRTAGRRPNDLSGRIAFQSFFSRDMKNPDYNYVQPGVVINLDINRVQGSYYTISSNIRFRKTLSQFNSDEYPMRVYELAVEYSNPSVPYRYSAGRIFAPVINGVGNFDGAFFAYRMSNEWEVGTFGGTQPDNVSSKPDMTQSKFGFFANYKKEFSASWRVNSTLAFSGQYVHNKIDREYLYIQNDASLGPKFYVYQNSEIGINRSRLSHRKKSVEISNLYVMGHYEPIPAVRLSASYDARVNVFLIQTYRSIPDSLFDDALLQGYRGDVSWRATKFLTFSASTSIRTKEGDRHRTYLNSAGCYYYNILRSQVSLNYRYFYTSTQYTKANSSSIGVSRQFSPVYLSATFRTYSYRFIIQDSRFRRYSCTLDGNLAISRRLYASFEYEYSISKVEKADRFFVELSYRF